MRLGLTKRITLRVGTVPFGRERPVIYIYIFLQFILFTLDLLYFLTLIATHDSVCSFLIKTELNLS